MLTIQIASIILFRKDFIYSRETQRERQIHRQREKQAPCREPDMGLNPGTPGPCPELKADAQPLSHPGVPLYKFLKSNIMPYCDKDKSHL